MKIVATCALTPSQREAVEELHRACALTDGQKTPYSLSGSLNFDPGLPCYYLGYEEGTLAAFLTAFIPGRGEAEVSAFTHPDWRRGGRFTALWRRASDVLAQAGVGRILFVLGSENAAGRAVLARIPAELSYSEYRMVRRWGPIPSSPDLTSVLVTPDLVETCARVSRDFFMMSPEEARSFIRVSVEEPDRAAYLAYQGDRPIGTYLFQRKKLGELFLYGVGIVADLRGRGYGRQLMGLALVGAAQASRIALDVDSANLPALNLYRSCGFEEAFRIDYYLLQ